VESERFHSPQFRFKWRQGILEIPLAAKQQQVKKLYGGKGVGSCFRDDFFQLEYF
jgi:hypothetical protein